MKKNEPYEPCGAEFLDPRDGKLYVCQKARHKHGKHLDDRESVGFVMWSNAGAKMVVDQIRAELASKKQKDSAE